MQFYFLLALYSVAAKDIQDLTGAVYSEGKTNSKIPEKVDCKKYTEGDVDKWWDCVMNEDLEAKYRSDYEKFCQIKNSRLEQSEKRSCLEDPNKPLPMPMDSPIGFCQCPTRGKETEITACKTYTGVVSTKGDIEDSEVNNLWDCVFKQDQIQKDKDQFCQESINKAKAAKSQCLKNPNSSMPGMAPSLALWFEGINCECPTKGKTNIDVCKKYSKGDLYKWWECVMKDLEAHYKEQAERQKKIDEAKQNGICPKDRFWTYFGGNNSGQWRIKTCLKNQFEVISDKTWWRSTPTYCYCPNLEISKEAALQCAVDHSSMFSAGSFAKALLWNDAIDNVAGLAATIDHILKGDLNVDQVFKKIDYQKWYGCVKTQLAASDSRGPQQESKDIMI